mgnify:CR=1 FL=1|tara:strand:- start:838 stop:1068 length:231 start_codon:yes stop_codon:yes gene_type:complete
MDEDENNQLSWADILAIKLGQVGMSEVKEVLAEIISNHEDRLEVRSRPTATLQDLIDECNRIVAKSKDDDTDNFIA